MGSWRGRRMINVVGYNGHGTGLPSEPERRRHKVTVLDDADGPVYMVRQELRVR